MRRRRKDKGAGGELSVEELIARFEREFADARADLGKFNLALFGKTGVGKSTLVNTIFSAQVARTGNGRPVTEGLDYYEHPSGFFGVFDSEGIQTGEAGDAILNRFRELIDERRRGPIEGQIHVAWYCVRWSDRRLEDSQAEFIEALAGLGVPVIFVMTQVPLTKQGLHPDALELAADIVSRGLPLSPENRVFHTMALADEHLGQPAHGLHELLDATFRVAPEGVEGALTAAQQIDLDRKVAEARKWVKQAAAAAAAAGATPIPFADAIVLVPIQVRMMAKTASTFGFNVEARSLGVLGVASLVGGGGASGAGRYMATNLIKAIPGGNIAAGVIRAGVASSLTYAVGEAWIAVCLRLYGRGPDAIEQLSLDEVRRLFLEEFKRRARSPEEPAPVAGV